MSCPAVQLIPDGHKNVIGKVGVFGCKHEQGPRLYGKHVLVVCLAQMKLNFVRSNIEKSFPGEW
jgi:hypothetical protein